MLITFYCTRCGTHLEVDSPGTLAQVMCEQCNCPTRVPQFGNDTIPWARLAGATQLEALPPPLPAAATLAYAVAGDPHRYARSQWRELVAERLENVVDDLQPGSDADSMTSCPYCGTTIARFIKQCPSCRHPLWGI